jgi:cytochrome c biogenesis protein CcmG, thiol:disulfide interchange protein DsbE
MMEPPQLQKIWEKYQKDGFTLLGVASDDQKTAAKIKPLILSKGFKFTVVTDGDRKIGNLYNVRNYPTTVLIAPDGGIASLGQGYLPGDEKELEAKIRALLGLPPAESSSTPGAGGTH